MFVVIKNIIFYYYLSIKYSKRSNFYLSLKSSDLQYVLALRGVPGIEHKRYKSHLKGHMGYATIQKFGIT